MRIRTKARPSGGFVGWGKVFTSFIEAVFAACFVAVCWIGSICVANAEDGPVAGVSPELSALIGRCAPTVHPETMAALVSAESRGHQYAIADAGPKNLPWSQRKHLVRSFYEGSLDAAEARALALIASGHTVSLGLTQINDRNLPRLGLTVRNVFELCTNLAAGGKVVTEFYVKAVREFGPGPRALRAALSAYNSGDWVRGEKDGYVNLVFKQRGKPLALSTARRAPLMVPAAGMARGGGRVFAMSAGGFKVE